MSLRQSLLGERLVLINFKNRLDIIFKMWYYVFQWNKSFGHALHREPPIAGRAVFAPIVIPPTAI